MAEAAVKKQVWPEVVPYTQRCPRCPCQMSWREIREVTSPPKTRYRAPRTDVKRFLCCHWCAAKEHQANERKRLVKARQLHTVLTVFQGGREQ